MFYTNFEELCRRADVAPSALARKLGMSPSAPGRWKSGSHPDLDTAQKIADYFGVTIDYLVTGQEPAPIIIHDTAHSVVLQGNNGNGDINAARGSIQTGGDDLTAQEAELLRIFRMMGPRQQTEILTHFYGLEDAMVV